MIFPIPNEQLLHPWHRIPLPPPHLRVVTRRKITIERVNRRRRATRILATTTIVTPSAFNCFLWLELMLMWVLLMPCLFPLFASPAFVCLDHLVKYSNDDGRQWKFIAFIAFSPFPSCYFHQPQSDMCLCIGCVPMCRRWDRKMDQLFWGTLLSYPLVVMGVKFQWTRRLRRISKLIS